MNSVDLESQIILRLEAAVIAATATVQQVASTIASPGIEIGEGRDPLVILQLLDGSVDDSMNKLSFQATYRVDIYEHRSNGTASAASIYDAIIGDGAPPDTASTYGIHRWKPSVVGRALSECRVTRFGYGHDGDILNYWITFEVFQEDE